MRNIFNITENIDFNIVLHYPDTSLTKYQRLLVNLAWVAKDIVLQKKYTPFIRVIEKDSNQFLVDDIFNISFDCELNKSNKTDYRIDIVADPDDNRTLYTCLYKDEETPVLFFDTMYFEYTVNYNDTKLLDAIKQYVLNKYSDHFKDCKNGLILVQTINLKEKKWVIKGVQIYK